MPFPNVLIRSRRDEQDAKMSKSLGNGGDPMDVIELIAVPFVGLLKRFSAPGPRRALLLRCILELRGKILVSLATSS